MFFDNFINLCARKNVSQADVARAISISGAAISKWKEGGIPRDITLAKLATYFEVSVDELLRNENEPVAQGDELDILDEIDVAFFGDFKDLTEAQKDTLRDMARMLKKSNQEKGL